MAKQIIAIIFLIYVFCGINGEDLPSYMTPCHKDDPSLSECVKQQIITAMPIFKVGEFGCGSLDPMNLPKRIEINEGGLDMSLDNPIVAGLANSKIGKVEFDLKNKKMSLQLTADIVLTGDYELGGKILVMPIQGKGKAIISAKGIQIRISSDLAIKKTNNGDVLKLESINFNYTIENTHFDFANMFNGNAELAEPVLKFANDKWETIMDSFGKPAIKQMVTLACDRVQCFWDKLTVDKMFA